MMDVLVPVGADDVRLPQALLLSIGGPGLLSISSLVHCFVGELVCKYVRIPKLGVLASTGLAQHA